MKIDTDYLRRHYAELSDEALADIDRNELVEAAQKCYDEEVASRRSAAEPGALDEPAESEVDDSSLPDWLNRSMSACSYVQTTGNDACYDATEARDVLQAAGIPCHLSIEKIPDDGGPPGRQFECSVLVPVARGFEAIGVLDVQLFNPRQEPEWGAHFAELSDEELRSVRPEVLCAGFLDRAERLKRVYEAELARRKESAS